MQIALRVTAGSEYGIFVGSGVWAIEPFDTRGEYHQNHYLHLYANRWPYVEAMVPTVCVGEADIVSGVSFIRGEVYQCVVRGWPVCGVDRDLDV